MPQYKPADSLASPRFCDVRTFMRLPNIATLDGVDFVVTGVPFDTGGSFRVGCRFGPQAIREASVILKPYNPELEVDIFDHLSGVDYGDIPVVPGYLEDSFDRIEEGLTPIFEKGVVPICLGGDHAVSLPILRALHKSAGKVALVHFDSHSDTCDTYFGKKHNHGTPFRRAVEEGLIDPHKSIQVGIRGPEYSADDLKQAKELGFEIVSGFDVRRIGFAETARRIKERVGDMPVYVTFDIDFLDPAFAPGTGTPEIGGFATWEALMLLRDGLCGLNILGFDLVEVLPSCDPSEITAFAAAGIAHEFISILAANRAGKGKE